MSQSATAGHVVENYETPLTPESWGKLGMWIFLAGDAMSFGALLAAYGAYRFGAENWPNPVEAFGGVGFPAAMTFLLICSSVSMVWSLDAMQKGNRQECTKWLAATVAGGALFLCGQAYEYTHLMHEGMYLAENAFLIDSTGSVLPERWQEGMELAEGQMRASSLFGTTFFMTTGFHGFHVLSGVIYLSIVLSKVMRGGYSADDVNGIEIAGLYWHFVDLVWILVFTFVYLV